MKDFRVTLRNPLRSQGGLGAPMNPGAWYFVVRRAETPGDAVREVVANLVDRVSPPLVLYQDGADDAICVWPASVPFVGTIDSIGIVGGRVEVKSVIPWP